MLAKQHLENKIARQLFRPAFSAASECPSLSMFREEPNRLGKRELGCKAIVINRYSETTRIDEKI